MITDGLNPLTVMLFMGAALAAAALILLYVFARVTKREPFARITLRLLLGGIGVYVVLFLLASITSHSRVLAVGEEKHICEIDCHLGLRGRGDQIRAAAERTGTAHGHSQSAI
jgi:hypothetical protein